MRQLNRASITVKVKQPFLDWSNSLTPATTLEEANEDATCYLVPEWDYEDKLIDYIRTNYEQIFENILFSYWKESTDWPENRTFEMFDEWFEVSSHSMVLDIVGTELEADKE